MLCTPKCLFQDSLGLRRFPSVSQWCGPPERHVICICICMCIRMHMHRHIMCMCICMCICIRICIRICICIYTYTYAYAYAYAFACAYVRAYTRTYMFSIRHRQGRHFHECATAPAFRGETCNAAKSCLYKGPSAGAEDAHL